MKKDTCQICKVKTDWNESFGYPSFIVCPKCEKRLRDKLGAENTMTAIFTMGDIRKEIKK